MVDDPVIIRSISLKNFNTNIRFIVNFFEFILKLVTIAFSNSVILVKFLKQKKIDSLKYLISLSNVSILS